MKRKKKITPAKKALARWKIIKEKKGKNYFLHYARSLYRSTTSVCDASGESHGELCGIPFCSLSPLVALLSTVTLTSMLLTKVKEKEKETQVIAIYLFKEKV